MNKLNKFAMLSVFNSEKKNHQGHRLKKNSCYFISVHLLVVTLILCIQNKISKIGSQHFVVLNLSNHIAPFSIGRVGKLNKVNFKLYFCVTHCYLLLNCFI